VTLAADPFARFVDRTGSSAMRPAKHAKSN
jgi:hypothetical protein